jgi:hypothetical protein
MKTGASQIVADSRHCEGTKQSRVCPVWIASPFGLAMTRQQFELKIDVAHVPYEDYVFLYILSLFNPFVL